jgi:hypothetical protein
MIFIQRAVFFLFPNLGEGIENTASWIKIISHHKHGIFFLSHIYNHIPVFVYFILRRAWRMNTQCGAKNYHISDVTLMSRKYVIKQFIHVSILYSLVCIIYTFQRTSNKRLHMIVSLKMQSKIMTNHEKHLFSPQCNKHTMYCMHYDFFKIKSNTGH